LLLGAALGQIVDDPWGCICLREQNITISLGGSLVEYMIPNPTLFVSMGRVLVIYAHPFTEDRPASPSPFLSLPAAVQLVKMGYAVAGTTYSAGGWAVGSALQDVLNAGNFDHPSCNFQTVVLAGFDMGSVVALATAERSTLSQPFDAVLAGCSLSGGSTFYMDRLAAFNVLQAVAGVFAPALGSALHPVVPTDQELAQIVANVLGNPSNFGPLEFVRVAMGIKDINFFYMLPFGAYAQLMNNSVTVMGEILNSVVGPTGGSVSQVFPVTIAPGDQAYLSRLGVNWASLLNSFKAFDYTSSFNAAGRTAMQTNADYTGTVVMPVVTINYEEDLVVGPQAQVNYRNIVTPPTALTSAYVSGRGHCAFTDEQLVDAVVLTIGAAQGLPLSPFNFTAPGYDPFFAPV